MQNDLQKQKHIIREKCRAFSRLNAWERLIEERPGTEICLTAVFELYEMMPEEARQRPVNVEGIMKMHADLACLG